MRHVITARSIVWLSAMFFSGVFAVRASGATLDADAIAKASGAPATAQPDGVVRIGWPRTDVTVTVDGAVLPPAAGLASWAAFAQMPNGDAMVMGDTVVFADEVDAAMDAAFAHALEVTAIHNHFFHDTPAVYFMHIGGEGKPDALAIAVKAVWDAIRSVRRARAQPVETFGGASPSAGQIDAAAIETIVGQPAPVTQGVPKVTIGRRCFHAWRHDRRFDGADDLGGVRGIRSTRADGWRFQHERIGSAAGADGAAEGQHPRRCVAHAHDRRNTNTVFRTLLGEGDHR